MPSDFDSVNNAGVLLAQETRFVEAHAKFVAAIALPSITAAQQSSALINVGLSLQAMDRLQESAMALSAATELRPQHSPTCNAAAGALTQLGVQLHTAGRLIEAEKVTSRAITLSPRASAYLNLGLLHRQLAREAAGASNTASKNASSAALSAALDAFAAARALDPGDGNGFYYASAALLSEGLAGHALELLKEGLEAVPSHAGLRTNLGFRLLEESRQHGDDSLRTRGLSVLGAGRQGSQGGIWSPQHPWQFPFSYTPGISAQRVHPRAEYACVLTRLEGAAAAMRAEARAAWSRDEFRTQHEGLAVAAGGWQEADLFRSGRACDTVGAPLPAHLRATCTALRAISDRADGALELTGAAFSAITRGTRLVAHCGTNNRRLVLHMGLQVPEPGRAHLRLGAPSAALNDNDASDPFHSPSRSPSYKPFEEIAWREGEAFVWDDSFAHEVLWRSSRSNAGSGSSSAEDAWDPWWGSARVILLLTFRHPEAQEPPRGPPCAPSVRVP